MCCYEELTLFLLRRPRQEEMTEFFRTTPRVWFKKVTPGYRKTVIQSDSRVHIPRTIDLVGGGKSIKNQRNIAALLHYCMLHAYTV